MSQIVPVILAGGVGSRMWPLSRELYPKQCINIADDKLTMIQATAQRVRDIPQVTAPIVVCNDEHRFLIAQQLQELGISDAHIILEPSGKNTAPAIALAAHLAQSLYDDAILLVLPSDHVIGNESAFSAAVVDAVAQAKQGAIVTFGVVPSHPETGYGYIRGTGGESAQNVLEFVEKPDLATAESYLASGDYYWNSGMFLFSASLYLSELAALAADIAAPVEQAFAGRSQDLDFVRVDVEAWENCANDSIDYAIMEKTDKAWVLPLSADWSDVGSWSALADIKPADAAGNVVKGDVLMHNTENCLIRAESNLVATVGVKDLIVVETADAVLVAHKDAAQDVKHIVAQVKADTHRHQHHHHLRVYRPWGWYQTIDLAERHQVKRILVKPGEKLSIQMHHHRAEHWIVVVGTAKVLNGETEFLLTENQSTYIPVGTVHALENPGKVDLEIIEVQTGGYLGEDDIVRFEDRYGRG